MPMYGKPNPLTIRNEEILTLTGEGYAYKQIAVMLHPPCSEKTVKRHIHEIILKLRARNRTHAVVIAIQKGYLTLQDTRE